MPSSPSIYFEDFVPGAVDVYGAYPVTREAIIAFAAEFDPQPFHLDEAAAKATLLRGLAASGWHNCGMLMRMNCDGFLLDAASLGAPGIVEVKWLKPVRPGAVLHVRRTTVGARPSRSRADMGLVDFHFGVLSQRDETVMTQRNVVMFRRRDAGSIDGSGGASPPARGPAAPPPAPVVADASEGFRTLPMFDDLAIGASSRLGSHTFTTDAIVRFARAYDPQRFHTDAVAALSGPFGKLAASGWQTCAIWMRTYLDWFRARAEATAAQGLPVPSIGPSPGFYDLKWLRPVFPGDTITYGMTVAARRASDTRPQWGVLTTHNRGVNQDGALVFEFSVASYWERRTRD